MRRRPAAVLAATLVGAVVAVLAPAGPAQATKVCAGQGTAAVTGTNPVGAGLLYPIGLPLVTITLRTPTTEQRLRVTFNNELVFASWNFSFGDLGACTNGKMLSATGTLKGYCGHSTGTGSTGTHKIEWNSVGTFLIFTNPGPNGTVGIASAIPDAVGGESCVHGGSLSVHTNATLTTTAGGNPLPTAGARRFIITGAVAKTTCAAPSTVPLTSTLLLSLGTVTVLDALVHVTVPLPNVHVRLHVCAPVKL